MPDPARPDELSDVLTVTLAGAPSTATVRPESGTLPRLSTSTVPVRGVPGNTWSDRLDGLADIPTSSNWVWITSATTAGRAAATV